MDYVAWFTRENYAAHKALDPNGLHPTFDEWLKDAKARMEQLERKGIVLIPVVIDPEKLAAWCKSQGTEVNAKARTTFVALGLNKENLN